MARTGTAGVIQGKNATELEMFVANSLIKFKWTFEFEPEYMGGYEITGGQIPDFLVSTVPQSTPIWIQGEYWHPSSVTDRDTLNRMLLYANANGQFAPEVIIWERDIETQEECDDTIFKIFGRN